jgi:hypothetical protein
MVLSSHSSQKRDFGNLPGEMKLGYWFRRQSEML